MKFPVKYMNGNYQVTILDDGTKIRYTPDRELLPSRPETIDINISNYCENNCPWCYINASVDGKHGDLNLKFFDTIAPFTEIAINYAKHPGLENFLVRMHDRQVIVNLTINQKDFNKDWAKLLDWQISGMFYGLGISINSSAITKKINYFDNVVAHTIYGITTMDSYKWAAQVFDKVLILGYKNKGRGKKITPKFGMDVSKLFAIFKIVSFDNLGIDQSEIKDKINEGDWKTYYMGEEGTSSFYIDTVEAKFYESSVSENGFNIGNKSVKSMYNIIRR